jgi:AraC-like DNA-binding protein
MLAHLEQPLRVEDLATQAGMSVRNFTRVFTERTGYSPAVYLERVRVEAACRRLAESSKGTKEIATECGFRDADGMRKAFRRVLNTTPQLYRHAFAAADAPQDLITGHDFRWQAQMTRFRRVKWPPFRDSRRSPTCWRSEATTR